MGAVLHSLPSFACAAMDCSPLSIDPPLHASPLHNLSVASCAPSAMAWNLAQTISGWRRPPSPQSVPAITFSRPTRLAYRTRRSATSSGCSTRLVAGYDARDQNLAIREPHVLPHLPLVFVTHVGSLDGEGLGTNLQYHVYGVLQRDIHGRPFQLPQHIWCRTRSSGMPLRA